MGQTIEFTSNLDNVWIARRRMLGLRHCRKLVNGWLAPSRTDVWGLLTGHSIVKPRLHKGPRCVGLFAGVFLPSNRFSGTAPHPNIRKRIPPWLCRPEEKKYDHMTTSCCHILLNFCVTRALSRDKFKRKPYSNFNRYLDLASLFIGSCIWQYPTTII